MKKKININSDNIDDKKNKEGFKCPNQNNLDNMYIYILKARARAIVTYLLNDPSFKPWIDNWNLLNDNLDKTNLSFSRLNDNDKDVAYVIDKGEKWSFRVRDTNKYLPLSVESYVLSHELAHAANKEIGHGDKFQELMHLIEVAAYLLGFIDIDKYPKRTIIYSNNQPILSRKSIKNELKLGIIDLIKHSNTKDEKVFWGNILNRIYKKKYIHI